MFATIREEDDFDIAAFGGRPQDAAREPAHSATIDRKTPCIETEPQGRAFLRDHGFW